MHNLLAQKEKMTETSGSVIVMSLFEWPQTGEAIVDVGTVVGR